MTKLIKIESANMKYDDDYNVESVKIEYDYDGSVLRYGSGYITIDHETFVQQADVKKMEQMVIEKIIGELEEAQTNEGEIGNDDE